MGCGTWISMVIVVPTFAIRGERNEPIITAVLAGFVIAVTPKMRSRINAPRYVPRIDRAIDDAPKQPLKANLITAGKRAAQPVSEAEPGCKKQSSMKNIHPEVQQVSLETHVEPVAENVARIFVIRLGRRRVPVFDKQPTDVAPERAHLRRMRISLVIGMLMMDPMDNDPAGGRLLQVANSEQGQCVLKPHRALKASVRQQSMKAGADTHRAEDIVADRQPKQAPPTKNVGQECQRNQQMKRYDADDVRPDNAALVIDQLWPRNAT